MALMLPLTDIVPPFLAAAAIAYAILAVRVARSTPHNPNNPINIFLFLMAGLNLVLGFVRELVVRERHAKRAARGVVSNLAQRQN